MTTPTGASASAYTDAKVTTASPQRLLVMLYDRLVLDLDRATTALESGTSPHDHLVHAQDIVMELLTNLDTEAWSGGPALSGLYTYAYTRLVTANVRKDASIVAEVRGHIEPLREAWHQAFASSGAPARSATPSLAADAASVALARPAAPADVRPSLSVTA